MIVSPKIAIFLPLFMLFSLMSSCCFAQLEFIENKGQWDARVAYKSEMATGAFFIEKSGFSVVLHQADDLKAFYAFMHGHISNDSNNNEASGATRMDHSIPPKTDGVQLRSHAYRVHFVGASPTAFATGEKALNNYNNYFIGNDKNSWQSQCKIFQAVTVKNIYPNIDVRYYSDAGTLKYDLIVHPGGNVHQIALQFDGVDQLATKNKELIIGTSVGEVKELFPYTYQLDKVGRTPVQCSYEVKGRVVKFKVKNADPSATLIIDPSLIFCSFTGSAADNWGYTATPGPDGSAFAGGICFGTGYPISLGAFSQSFNGGVQEDVNGPYDIAIIKFSVDGVRRLYATYLGGSGNEQPHSMICDARGNLVIAGRTTSPNFPVTNTLLNNNGGGSEIFVTKLNAAGSAIIGSMKVGGTGDDGVNIKPKYTPLGVPNQNDGAYETRRNYGDDARSEVILDGANNIFLASCTQSSDFPVTGSAFQKTFGGGRQDGVIIKFTPTVSGVLFSSFFGGAGSDACFVAALNPLTGNLYVAGGTTSLSLPGTAPGVVYPTYRGGVTDGFVTELTPNGNAIITTTFAGTAGNDLVYGVQFDKFGFPYIMGATTGNWPVINATYSDNGGKQFIAKLQPNLSGFVYSTVFGTNSPSPNISPVAFLVDRCQNVYVSGWGGKFNNERQYPNSTTRGMRVTGDAIKSSTDGGDFYFFVLEKDARSQLFGSFFGQSGGFDDHVDGGTSRFDGNGIIYQAICANCGGPTSAGFFPTTPGVWASVNSSPNCNEALVKIEMNFGGVGASVKATIDGVIDTVGCVPLTINFTDTLAKGKQYIWDYGDPLSPKRDTTFAPNNGTSHTYNQIGTYQVMVISIDSFTCNVSDTAFIRVRVADNKVSPNFIAAKIPPCNNLAYIFTNTTTAANNNFSPNSFLWDFGDGTPPVRAGTNSITHTYPAVGTYNVNLLIDDSSFCNAPAFINKQVRLAVQVKAQFETLDKGCAPYSAVFNNTSLGGTDFVWNFGDGTSSTEIAPTHLYATAGPYQVTLTATDTTTCNKVDATSFLVTVYPVPTVFFTASPNPGPENTPTQFANTTMGATSYLWDFGDGETSTATNPTYQFTASGTYNVCLQASNAAGCKDTFCLDVVANISPLVDVPNAFTPGKFGTNGVIKVEGFGIGKMNWKIYNRWGQVVFSANNKSNGWDGTFKGASQPMDVYTYTLDIEFTDARRTKYRKTGDITLLR